MLRMSLVGMTKTLDAKVHESKTIVPATMYPPYVKGADAVGSYDYADMVKKPSIEGVTLEGNITLSELGLYETEDSEIENLFK